MATITTEPPETEAITAYGQPDRQSKAPFAGRIGEDRRLLAGQPLLCMGMLYLKENPLLREPLKPEHIKARLLGHWGSDCRPGIRVHSLQSLDQQVRPECDLHLRPRPQIPAILAPKLSRRNVHGDYPDNREDPRACSDSSSIFFSRRDPQSLHAETPAAFMRGASWATASPTPTGPSSTTPT